MIMASIRVTCPMCGKLLEVGAEHAGQEVECGECLQVFVAEVPRPPKIKAVTNDLPPGLSGSRVAVAMTTTMMMTTSTTAAATNTMTMTTNRPERSFLVGREGRRSSSACSRC